ncbi:TIGR02678 family protein [Sporosarcina sp. FSL W8-0480]|uniref:TIGR02678 family protein n=1 Tax=Sporosarcina sp. FSL W8-0480 TaxID=2954701 RepID=UPI0030DD6DD0
MRETDTKEGLVVAIEALLENFLVERSKSIDAFREIRHHEKTIRKFMSFNFGYQLKMDSETIKLEKVPFVARTWMGVESFKDEHDYMFLMAILAILESKSADEGFLLSEIIEETKNFLVDIYEVEWKSLYNRQSFIRALTYAADMRLITVLDGDITDFEKSEEGEVLYRTTSLIRYVFRNVSKPISEFIGVEELLHDGLDMDNPLHTFFRKLYFESVVHFYELTEGEKKYLADEEHYEEIKSAVEHYTNFKLERSYYCYYLINRERKRGLEQHPSFKNESYIVTQVAKVLTERLELMDEKPMGLWLLKNHEFESILKETIDVFSVAWSRKMRETSFAKLKEMVIRYVTDWKLATYDETTMEITIYPPFIRTIGDYDEDLRQYIEYVKQQKEEKINNGYGKRFKRKSMGA